ncbi:hypothetical protein E3P99_02386 [Wallemia hederae]|uniref:Uncharacterized protein n=1 Tax=Wallemia hederae TaxID=1540922 RepID=A0A4T0FPR6_9BASI|nr:hypothetical protein E3P99_02386 [Wallemia hederae]
MSELQQTTGAKKVSKETQDFERQFNLEPSTHHNLPTRLQDEFDRNAAGLGDERIKSAGDSLVGLHKELREVSDTLETLESDAYPSSDFYYSESGKGVIRSVNAEKEQRNLNAIEDARYNQMLDQLTLDNIGSLTEDSNIVNLAYWSPHELDNPELVKQLSEDNTDLSLQAIYKQKELRDLHDKIRKTRMDVNTSTKELQNSTRGLISLDTVRENKVKGKFTPDDWKRDETLSRDLATISQKVMSKKFIVQHLILFWRPYWAESQKLLDRMFKMCEEGKIIE